MNRDEARRVANDLYWKSDLSVRRIGERLDLSKSGLYELIEPLPTSARCPVCGGATVYENRTARERRQVTCTACGATAPWRPPVASDHAGAHPVEDDAMAAAPARGAPGRDDDFGVPEPAAAHPPAAAQHGARGLGVSGRVMLGAALLGAGIGLFIALRRRR
ncbi:MAG: hypothetical protein D6701_07775 [Gemmatimonadetes bacterium]|nr:MAG: hypothetical protein D6701_07775 [Gemmatimonadota bacterium]